MISSFSIRVLSSCDPILFLSFLCFQLWRYLSNYVCILFNHREDNNVIFGASLNLKSPIITYESSTYNDRRNTMEEVNDNVVQGELISDVFAQTANT